MPVFIEFPQKLSQQDLADLQLIYADLPPQLASPGDNGQLSDLAQQQSLVVARFNGRLLAAAVLRRHEKSWCLSQLCVRAITRRRGVARRMFEELTRAAQAAAVELQVRPVAAPLWFAAWLEENFPDISLQPVSNC